MISESLVKRLKNLSVLFRLGRSLEATDDMIKNAEQFRMLKRKNIITDRVHGSILKYNNGVRELTRRPKKY